MKHRHDPFANFAGLERLQQELGRLFNLDEIMRDDVSSAATTNWRPSADIRETDDRFEISVDLPGVEAASIDVALKSGVLTVSGQRSLRNDSDGHYKLAERRSGEFLRRFTLPDVADEEQVDASTSNGVLKISVGKKARSGARKIQVVSGS